jgi:structural maintenance of chromosome 3 (chondroitin sulfate proteoglycan 6)
MSLQEERQALLHEGSGAAAVNAFVEIVFDNSDHRFQHENSDEVVLRRTIGLKKDEFFLQRKRTTKNEIQSLLEGAGFSKSNPYFIVQQGKVQALCTMSDEARLHLLKEVAGTTVYDEKKTESLAKMEENRKSIEKITEERLSELNSEKDELTAYQQLDRQRRAAEYSLYNIELEKARVQLVQIEHERAQHVHAIAELHEASKATHDAIRSVEGQARAKTNTLKRISRNVAAIEEDKRRAVGEFTRLDCECNELAEAIATSDEQAKTNQQLLKDLDTQIEKVKAQLETTTIPQCTAAEEELQSLLDGNEETTKEREALLAKQGRGSQFQTTEERDAFLQQAKQDLKTAMEENKTELDGQRDNLANLRRTVDQEEGAISKLRDEVTKKAAVQQTIAKSVDEMAKQRVELTETRRKHWREVEELQERIRESRETLHTCLADTQKVMPRATAMGLEALRSIVEREGIVKGGMYFGMVMENFKLSDDKYRTAVEAAAQNSLFHVIVDTDHTAARLMKHLEEGKLGRVTFLPLNQLRVEQVKYPENNEIRPMIDLCLEFDKNVSRAMQHIFGKKLIARTKDLASEWSTKVNMDVLTLDGDLCGRKGALTGGYDSFHSLWF